MGRFRSRRVRPPIEFVGEGRFAVHLDSAEVAFMLGLLTQLREVIEGAEADDARVRRLFPVAYPDDPERDAEYHELMHDELVRSRLASIDSVGEALGGTTADATDAPDLGTPLLDVNQVGALMHGINGLRLVLGTLLDVSEDDDPTTWPEDHPLTGEHHLYGWLSWLLEWTVQALSEGSL